MSRHDSVSCDSCMKSNFRGRRYKCLVCYDYDLCAACYEGGASSTRHTSDHPMQCIITRTDFDLYYGGEALTPELPQSFTCPYCGKMGFTEASLQDHVTSDHSDTSVEVVCPVCASLPGGEPNHLTDDFAAHLALEHRAPRDFDEPSSIRHVRRTPHAGRGMGGMRARRSNMHFSSGAGAGLTGLSPSSREGMDPIAELLSQLSSVRSRAAAAQNVSSQLQQLEMQLQRQQMERTPRGTSDSSSATARPTTYTSIPSNVMDLPPIGQQPQRGSQSANQNSQLLLSRVNESQLSESEQQQLDQERADRSVFVQQLLLSSLADKLHLSTSESETESEDDQLRSVAVQGASVAGVGGMTSSHYDVTDSDNNIRDRSRKDRKHKNMVMHNHQTKINEKEPSPL